MIWGRVPGGYPIFTYELGKAFWIALTDQRGRTRPDIPLQKPVAPFVVAPFVVSKLKCPVSLARDMSGLS